MLIDASSELDLRTAQTNYFQSGQRVLPRLPPFDEKKPFCSITALAIAQADAKAPYFSLSLDSISGAFSSAVPEWSKFITKLSFVHAGTLLNIVCYTDSPGILHELSIREFEDVFGDLLTFGAISADDPGINGTDLLAPETFVLQPKYLQDHSVLEFQNDVTLTPIKDGVNDLELVAQFEDGKLVDRLDYTVPNCWFYALDAVSNDDPLTISKGTRFRFSEISASYERQKQFSFGFDIGSELTGGTRKIAISCSSGASMSPVTLGMAMKTTGSSVKWINAF